MFLHIFLIDYCKLRVMSEFSPLPKQLIWNDPQTFLELEFPGHIPHLDSYLFSIDQKWNSWLLKLQENHQNFTEHLGCMPNSLAQNNAICDYSNKFCHQADCHFQPCKVEHCTNQRFRPFILVGITSWKCIDSISINAAISNYINFLVNINIFISSTILTSGFDW